MEIKQYLQKLDCVEVEKSALSLSENRCINPMFEKLNIFNSMIKQLQKNSTTMSDVRAIFYGSIEDYLEADNRLRENADIVQFPHFECRIAKLKRRN